MFTAFGPWYLFNTFKCKVKVYRFLTLTQTSYVPVALTESYQLAVSHLLHWPYTAFLFQSVGAEAKVYGEHSYCVT